MFGLRNQLAAGRLSRAAEDKYERETQALVEGRHAKWAATRYLSAYENAYRRAFDDPDYRTRAFEELDRPSFWSSWRLPSIRSSWSLPAFNFPAFLDSVRAFLDSEYAGLIIIGGGITVLLAFGAYLHHTGWKPEKKAMSLLPPQPPKDTYGSAEWEQPHGGLPDEMTIFKGVFFGKSSAPVPAHSGPIEELQGGAPIFSTPENHTLIVARTRTGKGTRVLVPTLLRYLTGSALVIDPKGENAAITARARMAPFPGKDFHQTVHIINPWGELTPTFQKLGLTPFATYNPLDILDRNDPLNAVSIVQDLAAAICPTGDKPGKEAFWAQSAASMLMAVLLWITYQPGETKTLGRAREIVTKPKKELYDDFLIPMAAVSHPQWTAIPENAGPFIGMAQETFSGIMGNLAQFTAFLSDPRIKAATATSSFSMQDLVRKLTTVYLVIQPHKMKIQGTWLRLMISACMQAFKTYTGEKRVRCMFMIDEFPALGKLEEVPRDIATMAGYGVDFVLAIQGLNQLKKEYGEDAMTIVNNCAYQWFCNLYDLPSAEYLSKTLGNKTVQTISGGTNVSMSPTGGSSGTSTTTGQTGRPLLMPSEILNLGRDVAILLAPGFKPQWLLPADYWNLAQYFAHLRKSNPHLYWDPPLKWDDNPLPH